MPHSTVKRHDVLGLGCTAVDEVLEVTSFPASDTKVRVERRHRTCGGLTGTALVAAARLGARCAFAGCLGPDEYSRHVAAEFTHEGVDLSAAPRLPNARVVHSTIVVGRDTGSRNIFFQVEGHIGAHDSLPDERVIRESRVLFIDHYGLAGNLRAARIARSCGVSVVADFESAEGPLFPDVLALVDHLILSEEFALAITGQSNADDAALALWHQGRSAVIVTCGANGCWSLTADDALQPIHHPAFAVLAANTTGCGDVFHGAYAARLARGDPLGERIRFASAAAALKAGQGEIPDADAVAAFLAAIPARMPPPSSTYII